MKSLWTVVLLRPDYIASEYGEDTYVAHVDADASGGWEGVIEVAQKQAYKADKKDKVGIERKEDYKAIAIFAGHQECYYWAWMS